MLTTMTTADNLSFSTPFLSHHHINFMPTKQPCFKMKNDTEHMDNELDLTTPEDGLDVSELLERLGIADIDYDDDIILETEYNHIEPPVSGRSSMLLSGGGLLIQTPNIPSTSSVCSSSPDFLDELDVTHSTNPFRNHLRHQLEEEVGSEFSATNPFSSIHPNIDLNRTESQCSTRAVSPVAPELINPFSTTSRPNSFIFVLPPPETVSQGTQTSTLRSDSDVKCIEENRKALQASGWFYENISWQDSAHLLEEKPAGTFLVRNSQDPNYIFSLSLQTTRGPTSVRLHYENLKFRLAAEVNFVASIPRFDSVIELIEHYIASTVNSQKYCKKTKTKDQVWVDVHGQVYSNIFISKPLYKVDRFPKLKHLCRLEINKIVSRNYAQKGLRTDGTRAPVLKLVDSLTLPQSMIDYLKEYPFLT